jgi:predicted nucleotidyltransferase component of viral defense system
LQHHDRASLLAGKLHALFQRRYVKGRDLYDLMWYLSDPNWPEPNLTLLQNALVYLKKLQP